MKRTIHKPRLLTVFLTFLAIFLGYFTVKNESFSLSVKSWVVTNVSGFSNHFNLDELLRTKKIVAELKDEEIYSVTSTTIKDQPSRSPFKPLEESNKQEQDDLGGELPKGEAVTRLTGWPLLQQRAAVVQQVCRRFKVQQSAKSEDGPRGTVVAGTYTEHVSLEAFQMIRSASTLTCVINKVASTSLITSFLKADKHPRYNTGSPHTYAAKFLKPKTEMEFAFAKKHFFKFLLVRHPFARLLSAYRDKVERANHWSLKKMRKHIIMTLAQTHPPNKTHHKVPQDSGDSIPTFSDFLEYILVNNYTGGGFDSHWAPYWQLCSPCALKYDVIAKLETADMDLRHIWQKIGLHEPEVPWFNRMSQNNTNGATINPYYQALDPVLIAQVYHRYFLDFEMFQYSILDVLREGDHCLTHNCSNMISYFL